MSTGRTDGEEDTNDGDYEAGYDETNPYTGQADADYRDGYRHGYEDAYEEIIETGRNDEEEPI